MLVSSFVWAAGPKEGAPAPQASVKTLDGKRMDIAALRGNVIVVTFWATWCQYCKQELADLSDFYREHAQDGLSVIAISADDAEDAGKVRAQAKKYPFPVALQADADASAYGRIWRLPLTFVIDRRGVLRRDGWSDTSAVTRQQMDATITPLLRDKN
jgi:peroxiredoxin